MSARRPMTVAVAMALVLSFVLSFAALTDAKKRGKRDARVTPKVGIYSAEPIKPTGDFQLGSFAAVRDRGDIRIVSLETNKGIYYPDLLECGAVSLPLRKEAIRVNRAGRFTVRDSRRTLNGKQVVRWSGHWVRPSKVRGQVRIKLKRCKSKYRWKADRLSPVIG